MTSICRGISLLVCFGKPPKHSPRQFRRPALGGILFHSLTVAKFRLCDITCVPAAQLVHRWTYRCFPERVVIC
ncbi:unnamed protein product [Mycena citricolor]|uniref:Uncharacterized protein n=1 Tax=Mycena citricolor TaxID=2018698 RepID=A0AAD2HQR6_9AGAR|nr:unnamed protein product [Mycena citricolor]